MIDPHLWKIWGIAETNLKDARRYVVEAAGEALTDEDKSSLTQFDEYVAHNEFGLALEEMASLGSGHVPKAAFWKRLEAAAEAMELPEAASIYREKFFAEVHRQ